MFGQEFDGSDVITAFSRGNGIMPTPSTQLEYTLRWVAAKLLKEILPRFGFEEERLRLTWIGASDGIQFAEIMRELVEQVRALGPRRAPLALAM